MSSADKPRKTAKAPREEPDEQRDRIDLRADPEWIVMAKRAAKRMGLGLTAYIRLATSERMVRDGLNPPEESS